MGENDEKDPARGCNSEGLHVNPGNSVEENENLHMLATTVVSLEPEMACQNCASLQENLNAIYVVLQDSKQQHVKTVATLKKKIISTDLLIREYQSQKNECEVLKRKIDEFACLVSQLDKDLTRYKAELMTTLNELEPLKKADVDRTKALEEARKECEFVKDQAAALRVTNNQLEAKVRQLESAETLAAQDETKLTTLEKELKKLQRTAEQYKEEKTDCRKKLATQRHELVELRNKLRKAHKYAMTWGKLADKHGILVGANRRVFESLSQPKGDPHSALEQAEEDVGNSSEEDAAAVEDNNGGQLLEILLEQENATVQTDTPRVKPLATEKIVGNLKDIREEVTDITATDRTKPILDLADSNNVTKGDSADLFIVGEAIREAGVAVIQDNLKEGVRPTVPHDMNYPSPDKQAPTLSVITNIPSQFTNPTGGIDSEKFESGDRQATLKEDLLLSEDSQSLEQQAPTVSSELSIFVSHPPVPVPEEAVMLESLDLSYDEEEIISAAPIPAELRQGSNETVAFHDNQRAEICESEDVPKPPTSPGGNEIDVIEQPAQKASPRNVQDASESSHLPGFSDLLEDPEKSTLSPLSEHEPAVETRELSQEETRSSSAPVVEDVIETIEDATFITAPAPLRNNSFSLEAARLKELDSAVFKVPDSNLIPDIVQPKLLRPADSYEKNVLPIVGPSVNRKPEPVSDFQSQKEELEEILRLMTADVPFLTEDDMITSLSPSPEREICASSTPASQLTRPQTFHSSSVGFEPTLTDSDILPAPKLPTPTSESVFEEVSFDQVATKEEVSVVQPDTLPKAKSASVRPACLFDWRGKKLETKPNKGRPMFLNTTSRRKLRMQIPFLRLAALRTLAFSETYLPQRRSSVTNFAEAERKHVSKSRDFCEYLNTLPAFFSSEDCEKVNNSKVVSSAAEKKKKAESCNKHADLFGDSGSEEEIPPPMVPPRQLLRTLPQRTRRNALRIHPVSVNLPVMKTTAPQVVSISAECTEIPHTKPDSSSQKGFAVSKPTLECRKPTVERKKIVLPESPEGFAGEDMLVPPRRQRKARLSKANAVTSLEAPLPITPTPEQEFPTGDQITFLEKDEISAQKTSSNTREQLSLRGSAIKRKRGEFTEAPAQATDSESPSTISAPSQSGCTTFPDADEEFEAVANKVARLDNNGTHTLENELQLGNLCTNTETDELSRNAQLTEISVEDVINVLERTPSSLFPVVLNPEIESDSVTIGKPMEVVNEEGREPSVSKLALTLAERQRRKLERMVSAPFSSHVAKSDSEGVCLGEEELMVKAKPYEIENAADEYQANVIEEIASPEPGKGEILRPGSPVQEIPLEPVKNLESSCTLPLLVPRDTRPLMEIITEKMAQKAGAKFALHLKPSAAKVMKKSVRAYLNKITKAETLVPDLVMETAERLTRRDVQADPYFAARHMIALLRKDETEIQITFTPPAPPLTTTQQRMITVIQAVKKHPRMQEVLEQHYDPEMVVIKTVQDILLRSSSQLNSIPMYEMSALTRFVTALVSCRGDIGLMRTFWYDIMYFRPAQAYALTYVLLTVWPDILRHSSFCLGPSPLEQTIVYLLTTCNAVKAVPGPDGKVIASRNLLKDAFGFQSAPAAGVNELCLYLTEKVKGCRNLDEMRSLASCFALLVRWEGHACGIRIVKEHLWPLLEEWSAGQGEDVAAATALLAIGWLGRSFPTDGQEVNKKILQVLKTLISQPENVSTVMQESIMETVILLGAQVDKVTVRGLLKSWQPPRDVPGPLLDTMCAFVGSNRELFDDS